MARFGTHRSLTIPPAHTETEKITGMASQRDRRDQIQRENTAAFSRAAAAALSLNFEIEFAGNQGNRGSTK